MTEDECLAIVTVVDVIIAKVSSNKILGLSNVKFS